MGGPKPALLCLHGSGTNRMIFEVQTARLRRALSHAFDFEYLQAPLEAAPGPGVLPFFEGCGPFFSWAPDDERHQKLAPGTGFPTLPAASDAAIRRALRRRVEDTGRPFAGLLGFSQGTRAIAGALLRQEFGGGGDDDENENSLVDDRVRFAVLLNGTWPPLCPEGEPYVPLEGADRGDADDATFPQLSVPSVHFLGARDHYLDLGRKAYEKVYREGTKRKVEFDVDHRVPNDQRDVERMAREIVRCYEGTL